MDELLKAVKDYAHKNYERGWDVVVECLSDREILAEIGNARTLKGALAKLRPTVQAQKARDAYAKEVTAGWGW